MITKEVKTPIQGTAYEMFNVRKVTRGIYTKVNPFNRYGVLLNVQECVNTSDFALEFKYECLVTSTLKGRGTNSVT